MAPPMRAAPTKPLSPSVRGPLRGKLAVVAIAAAAGAASLAVESGLPGLLAAGLALVVTAIAVIDARSFIIPDELNAAGIVLGFAHAGLTDWSVTEGLMFAALRGAVLMLVFLAIRTAYRRLRGRDGLGLGDVKLAAMAGVWLDWTMMPVAIDLAAAAALVAYVMSRRVAGRALSATGRLPFGLFFAPAIWIGWLLQQWPGG